MTQEVMTAQEFRASGLQIRTSTHQRDYKQELLKQIRDAELPEPTPEYQFHPTRKWRFDFYFAPNIAVEYEGGVFSDIGGHKSVSGILRDIEKYTEAQLAGFIVIRCTAQTVANGTALRYIKRALKKAAVSSEKSAIIPESQKVKDAKRTLKDLLGRLED